MEVAIRTFRLTKRNLDVNTQRGHAKIVAQATQRAVCSRSASNLFVGAGLAPPAHCVLPSSRHKRSTRHHLHPNLPLTRPVKLTQKYSLPSPQRQLPTFHKHHLARPSHHGLRMRIRIPFSVPVRPSVGYQPIENSLQIRRHVRVSVLVDHYSRRRVAQTRSKSRPLPPHPRPPSPP